MKTSILAVALLFCTVCVFAKDSSEVPTALAKPKSHGKNVFIRFIDVLQSNKAYHSSQGWAFSNFTADMFNTVSNLNHKDHFYTDVWTDAPLNGPMHGPFFYKPQRTPAFQEYGPWKILGVRNTSGIVLASSLTETGMFGFCHWLSKGGPKKRALATGILIFSGWVNYKGWRSWSNSSGRFYDSLDGMPRRFVHFY